MVVSWRHPKYPFLVWPDSSDRPPQGSSRFPRYCSACSHFHRLMHPEDSYPDCFRSISEFRAIRLAVRRIMARLAACPAFHLPNGCLPPDWVLCASDTVSVLIEFRTLLRISPVLISARSAIVESSVSLLPIYPGV